MVGRKGRGEEKRKEGREGGRRRGRKEGREGGRRRGREGGREGTYLHVSDLSRVEQGLSFGLGVEGGHDQHRVTHGHPAISLGDVLGEGREGGRVRGW